MKGLGRPADHVPTRNNRFVKTWTVSSRAEENFLACCLTLRVRVWSRANFLRCYVNSLNTLQHSLLPTKTTHCLLISQQCIWFTGARRDEKLAPSDGRICIIDECWWNVTWSWETVQSWASLPNLPIFSRKHTAKSCWQNTNIWDPNESTCQCTQPVCFTGGGLCCLFGQSWKPSRSSWPSSFSHAGGR